ncbi:MAG: sigma 54-interacting transcriptional regulator [bacterium]
MPVFAFGIKLPQGEKIGRRLENLSITPELLRKISTQVPCDEFCLFKSKSGISAFAVTEQRANLPSQFFHLLNKAFKLNLANLEKYQYWLDGSESVRYFYKLAIGLEQTSEIIQAVQEFQQCFEAAREADLTGPYLHRLFQRGVWLAEKVRLELHLQKKAVTPESVVTELAQKIFGDLGDHSALIASRSTRCENFVQKLYEKNIGQLLYVDTNQRRMERLFEQYGSKKVTESQLSSVLNSVDLLLLFDENMKELVSSRNMTQIMNLRNNSPLFLVTSLDDASRNQINKHALSKIYNLYYYDRNDLQEIVTANLKEHLKVAEVVDQLIDNEVQEYISWVHSDEQYQFGNIIGKSKAMQRILELTAKIAQTDISVLIDGESGTGKELVARSIHEQSRRAKNPFVVVNCGAMSETLLESELFGHVRGAFTGATSNKKGLFEVANHGTIFLDEIGETSQATQVKLLRFLQDGEIKPVGSNQILNLDLRLISATNRDLEQMAEEGSFRQDLYYRLNVIQITIPPLRERKEDILPLAEFFIKKYSTKIHKTVHGLDEQAVRLLLDYDWPGNVRELENAIERAVALSIGKFLTKGDLPPAVLKARSSKTEQMYLTLKELERNHIAATLKEHNWNYELVARILGIGRTTLWRKMKEYHLYDNQKEKHFSERV